MNWRKYLYNQNWNIGFVQCTPELLLKNKRLGKIAWMKHPYKDRFFADPFFLEITDEVIIVFVEELEFSRPIGRLVEIVVDVKTKELIKRNVLLELSTHLSYPVIKVIDGRVLVYPENGASGKLSLYEYNRESHSLEFIQVISDEPLTDATIFEMEDCFLMFATKAPNTQDGLFLYKADNFTGEYKSTGIMPISRGERQSRQAGNLFIVNDKIYRPVQNCEKRYGAGIEIMEIMDCHGMYNEKYNFSLNPQSFRYNRGLHTINFMDDLCVIDGYGYLYPVMGRIMNGLSRIKRYLQRRNGK